MFGLPLCHRFSSPREGFEGPTEGVYESDWQVFLEYACSSPKPCLNCSAHPEDCESQCFSCMRLAFRTVVAFARICQDSQGRTFLGSGHGVPFTTAEQLKLSLTEVSSGFVQHQVPDATPNNVLLASLVQQLQPHRVFSGEEAPFKLQLTQLSDGCALGVSVSHLLAGDAAQPGPMPASFFIGTVTTEVLLL